VGGTSLAVSPNGTREGESAWSGSGGGNSAYEMLPYAQAMETMPTSPATRSIPDVAYNGDPSRGFAIYDSFTYMGNTGWLQVGGTSAGAPQWAALIAIVNSMRAAAGKSNLALSNANGTLYALYDKAGMTDESGGFFDITTGANGNCGVVCTAVPGYDFVTGLGSPDVPKLAAALAAL
jgi:subtilase family serine protease